MDELSIVIVNYNSGDFLLKCLLSLSTLQENVDKVHLEVWIVDNASIDTSLKKVKDWFSKGKTPFKINYLENKENSGFGKANNLALKKILGSSSKSKAE